MLKIFEVSNGSRFLMFKECIQSDVVVIHEYCSTYNLYV